MQTTNQNETDRARAGARVETSSSTSPAAPAGKEREMGALIDEREIQKAVAAGAEHWVRGEEIAVRHAPGRRGFRMPGEGRGETARYPVVRWDGSGYYPHGLTGSVLLHPDGRMEPVYGLSYDGGHYGWPSREEIAAARTSE